MNTIESIVGLNEKGRKHAMKELKKYVKDFKNHNHDAWIDDINYKISERQDPNFEISSRYTHNKCPYIISFSNDMIETELVEL